jgi:hypothetical protein
MNDMAQYWRSRYLQALSKLETAQSTNMRSAYLDLASHYLAMQQFCDRTTTQESHWFTQ